MFDNYGNLTCKYLIRKKRVVRITFDITKLSIYLIINPKILGDQTTAHKRTVCSTWNLKVYSKRNDEILNLKNATRNVNDNVKEEEIVRILELGTQLSRAALVARVHIGLISSPVSPMQNNILQQRGTTTYLFR